jgi:HTH-type transcriptional regulator/antitoxin HigA
MYIKVIKTQEDYNNAIAYLETIGDKDGFEENPELIKQFGLISALVELYEKDNFPLNAGDPLEIIKLKMQMMGIQ